MASLNKLAIRGIRSFDDKHVQVIEFYSPLTVIVGHNGSGKTTIIECLKYATTGDLPPNTKGGAFVHDPKMANEKEVKAQVRLRFWNVNRQRMTVTRSLQVTVKKAGGLTMKTLEGLLAKTEPDGGDGKRNVISTKCSEMDEEVPLLMGVSKAILENVIFCHQEDSNWPLSEPAALKKKFDDIFEATRYTKALDNIKALRKERTAELKVDKERLKFFKADKDKAEKLRKDLAALISKENAKETEVENLKEEFERLKEHTDAIFQTATGFQQVYERHESLTKRKEMFERNRERIKEEMNVLKEPTEELQNMFSNFDAHLNTIEGNKDKQVQLKDKEEQAREELERQERHLVGVQGGLLGNRKNHEQHLRDREKAVHEVAKAHNIPGFDYSPLEDTKVAEFVERFQDLIRKAESDLKRIQTEGARKDRELQAELDALANAKSAAVATRASKDDQIVTLSARIRAMDATFDSISSVDADISVLENDIAATEDRKNRLSEEIRSARYDEQMREKASAIRQKEADRDKANSELSALNRQADTRAQLSIKRNELQSKSNQVEASTQSHSAKFSELVGSDINPETMEDSIAAALSRKDRELVDAESSAAASSRSLSQIQTSLGYLKQNLKTKNDEVARLEAQIATALQEFETPSVDEAIGEAHTEVNLRKDELADTASNLKFYNRILELGQTKKKCLGCDRAIHANETPGFELYIKARIDRCSSADLSEVKEELALWQGQLDNLRAVQPSVAVVAKLKEVEIPALQKQITDETANLSKVQGEVEDSKVVVQKVKQAARDLVTLKSAAAIIARAAGDIKDLKSDIQRLERDLEASGSLKTVDEVQQDIDNMAAEIKNLQREQHNLSADKELKVNTLRGLGDDHSRKTVKLSELRSKQERHKLDELALRQQQESLATLQKELKELDAKAQAAVAPWKEKKTAQDRYRAERQNAENDAMMQVNEYQSSFNDLENTDRLCKRYVAEGNDRKIRENEAHMEQLRGEIVATREAQGRIEKVISKLTDDISSANATRRNIKANIDYRVESQHIDAILKELADLPVKESAERRKEFNKTYQDSLDQQTSVQNRWQLASGVLLQLKEQRKSSEKTLKDEYKNIDKTFKEQLIKTKTSEVANNDLEKYGKALDNAILKYHSIKMDEINDTIGHLWNKTYQGTDIDGIRIVSDHDEASTSARKNYNYRVVMVKNDVELDMRGRCSAGQKVLASIIIRLALAESFGQGCGVLALDEPTTNLDQENINALAEALAEIIRERRRQNNFQLIVITHDEGFLQRLAAHDVLEYYWRVSRDASQKSVLERQRVGL